MSKGSKKQFKQFSINSIEDGMLVLKGLIVPVITDLEKFEDYSKEAEHLLKKYTPEDSIPAKEYDSVHDKLLYQQRELLRFIADHQSSSFSYISLRPILIKKSFLKREISEESNKVLNELLDIRNWSFHNAQSMTVADLEIAKKSIPSVLAGSVEIKPMLNPVVKEDYQSMFNDLPDAPFMMTSFGSGLTREIQYMDQDVYMQKPASAGSEIASLSMGIQKGQYDGTDQSFEQWTGKQRE